jgi:hypothetical protein
MDVAHFSDVAASRSVTTAKWSASAMRCWPNSSSTARCVGHAVSVGLCAWRETGFDFSNTSIARLIRLRIVGSRLSGGAHRSERRRNRPALGEIILPIISPKKCAALADEVGVWTIVDGAFMGVEPGSDSSFSSYAWRMSRIRRKRDIQTRFCSSQRCATHFRWMAGRGSTRSPISFGLEFDGPDSDSLVPARRLPAGLCQKALPVSVIAGMSSFSQLARGVDYFVDGRLMSLRGPAQLEPNRSGSAASAGPHLLDIS